MARKIFGIDQFGRVCCSTMEGDNLVTCGLCWTFCQWMFRHVLWFFSRFWCNMFPWFLIMWESLMSLCPFFLFFMVGGWRRVASDAGPASVRTRRRAGARGGVRACLRNRLRLLSRRRPRLGGRLRQARRVRLPAIWTALRGRIARCIA